MVSKLNFLGLSFLIVILFPLFPKIFGNNSQHILILGVTLACLNLTLNWKGLTFKESTRLLYFLCFFVLLFIVFLFEFYHSGFSLPYNDLFALTKPFYLGLFFLLGYASNFDIIKIISGIKKPLKIIIILGLVFSLIEIYFIESIKEILYTLYKREERNILLDKSTTWFGVTYYSGFFWLIISMFSMHLTNSRQNKKIWVFLTIASLVPLFLSQSRTILLSFLFVLIVMFFDSNSFISSKSNLASKSIRLILIFVLVTILSYIFLKYYDLISTSFGYIINTFNLILEGKYYLSGSLMTRLDQITYAIDANQNILFGWGLGRELPLESIYAAYYYRYGLPFLIITIFIILNIGLKMRKLSRQKLSDDVKAFCRAMYLVMICSPIAFFSSPILETPKVGFVYFFLIGLSIKLYENIKYNNTSL